MFISIFILINIRQAKKVIKEPAIVWQKLEYDQWKSSELQEGPVGKDFFWNEIPSSKKFYVKMQKELFGHTLYGAPDFRCGELIREYDDWHDLKLEMIESALGNKDEVLLSRFKIGLNFLLQEFEKRGVNIKPEGQPKIFRYEMGIKKAFKDSSISGLFALPGCVMIWLLLLLRIKLISNKKMQPIADALED